MINESTTDGSIETLLMVTKLGANQGIFNDTMVREVKGEFMAGIRGSLKLELPKIPTEHQQEFKKVMGFILNPIERVSTIVGLIDSLSKMVIVKKSLFKRYNVHENINESINFNKVFSGLKQKLSNTKEDFSIWWNKNSKSVIKAIADYLIKFVMGTLNSVAIAITQNHKKGQHASKI